MKRVSILPMASEFGEQHKKQLQRLVGSLRSLIESSVALTAPVDTLTELADSAEALSVRATELAGERPFERYSHPVGGDINTILPWSVISGRYNPLAAPVVMSVDGDKVIGEVTLSLAYEGPPNGVHGAIVAGVYDQLLAFAAMVKGTPGHTAFLTTRYRAITPIDQPLRFEAWVDRLDGRKTFTSGQCFAGDTLVSEAEALFIKYKSPEQI